MISIEISIESEGWSSEPLLEGLVERALASAIEETRVELAKDAEVSLVFKNDESVRELNKVWRQQDKPTNVLSFPAAEPHQLPTSALVGDIVIARETVAREADAEGKTFDAHLSHLIVHGFLHLVGFDHETDDEAEEMEAIERRVLSRLGIPDPYREDGPNPVGPHESH